MSFLIRIILQRLLLLTLPFLTFLGIDPDVTPLSIEEIKVRQENQDRLVDEILSPDNEDVDRDGAFAEPKQTIQDIENQIVDLQDSLTEKIIDPVHDIVIHKAVPLDAVVEGTDFDVKDVVVNVLCLEKTSTYTKLSTGSGVIVSSTGLVLTNAHVAYPFLQTPQFGHSTYSCSVRRENIPNVGFNAELVYYPIDWLRENSEVIKDPSPVGTGENDYALLLLTTPIGPAPKPDAFPVASLGVSSDDLKQELPVTIAGYPSSNSGIFEVDANPGLRVADTSIEEFFTFASRTYDVLQTDVNTVAKRGSSGGGVFSNNQLYGLIVTTNQNDEGSYANALTVPYIKRDFISDTGFRLEDFILEPLDVIKARFSSLYQGQLQELISESLGR